MNKPNINEPEYKKALAKLTGIAETKLRGITFNVKQFLVSMKEGEVVIIPSVLASEQTVKNVCCDLRSYSNYKIETTATENGTKVARL